MTLSRNIALAGLLAAIDAAPAHRVYWADSFRLRRVRQAAHDVAHACGTRCTLAEGYCDADVHRNGARALSRDGERVIRACAAKARPEFEYELVGATAGPDAGLGRIAL